MIKHIPNLDPTRPIQTQVQVVNLPGSAPNEPGSFAVNPYEAIHSYIHLVVAPYFDAYVNEKGVNTEANTIGKKHDDSKMGIPMTKKKIAELELSLLYLQQNVVIPEVFLNVHPIVQRAVEKVGKFPPREIFLVFFKKNGDPDMIFKKILFFF